MERVLKFRDNQHEEDRVMKLHGGTTGHQTDSGIEQNDYEDEQPDDDDEDKNKTKTSNRRAEKRRRRRQTKKKKSSTKIEEKEKIDDEKTSEDSQVEIEYVQEDIPVKSGDGLYSHFVKVFENFKLDPTVDENGEFHYNKYGKKVPGPKVILPRDKTNLDDEDDDDKSDVNEDKKKKDGIDEDEDNKKKSKRQLKRETRLSVAQLKQLVIRPDVVEVFDVTAKDPKLLVHLKVKIQLKMFDF